MKKTFIIEQSMTIATGKVGSFQLTIPATGHVTLNPVKIQTDAGPIVFSLLEDYSFVAAGSAITPIPTNRIVAPVSAVVVKSIADTSAVAGAAALSISQLKVGAAMLEKQSMGEFPITLKPGAKYLLVVTNSNAGNANVNFSISWDE